ncbi:MAG: flagellar basal-body rod protein FlgF [candidate division Zixibacteria bacterium]|nr:flagellar basal-body rod protein FlgF [candidate division Zixibacteria bacterium]
MIKGIFEVASGMMPRITKQDVIANNMANTNTVGYKRDRVFLDKIVEEQAKLIHTDYDWQDPMINSAFIDHSQAILDKTDNSLDIALDGEGFFVIETGRGTRYTRNGEMHVDANGILKDARGNTYLSDAGPVILQNAEPSIDSEGNIFDGGEQVGRLRVVQFENPQALSKDDGVCFIAPEDVEPLPASGFSIRQGFLERSNVSILDQMVDMIATFRDFESGQKAITIQDEAIGQSINRVGRTY